MNYPDADRLVANVVAVNFSGRFNGQEVKDLGQAFLNHVVAAKHVGLVLGQQVGELERIVVLYTFCESNIQLKPGGGACRTLEL